MTNRVSLTFVQAKTIVLMTAPTNLENRLYYLFHVACDVKDTVISMGENLRLRVQLDKWSLFMSALNKN